MERDKVTPTYQKEKNSFSEMSKIHEINPTNCEKEDTVLCILGQCQKYQFHVGLPDRCGTTQMFWSYCL